MCPVLEVSRAGYYAWIGRPESPRAARRAGLLDEIRQAHLQSRGTYGSPRVHRALRAKGVAWCENTVAELMRRDGVRGRQRPATRRADDRLAARSCRRRERA